MKTSINATVPLQHVPNNIKINLMIFILHSFSHWHCHFYLLMNTY